MSTIDELAATVREQLEADERLAQAAQPGPWISGSSIAHLVPKVVYGQSIYWPGHVTQACNTEYAGERSLPNADHIARHDPAAVLRDVATRRAMLERMLAEKHHVADDQWYTCPAATRERDGGTYAETDGGGQCTCRRDERVAGYLGLMAQAWQETT